ncbi:MAG TPA: HEPN domain-containing protein [Acetobacteraceae bacterium]|nr:HEPN domain-containing protein [Acetobacteraceae bacterium]
MLSVSLNEDAARVAYLAGFHMAQAYSFERTWETSKSYHGVQTEFLRLSKDDASVDHQLRRFLSQSYEFKSVADYGTGPEAATSAAEAADAVATARRFVSHFRELIVAAGPGNGPTDTI